MLTKLFTRYSGNSGGAWDNAKKYIEAGGLGPEHPKGSAAHKNFVYVGDACRAIVIYVPRSKRKEYETGFGRRRHGLPATFRNARFEYRTLY